MLRVPVAQLARQARDLQQASGSVGRVRSLVDTPRRIVDGKGVPLGNGPLSVDVTNVSIEYIPGVPVLRNVSFHLDAGRALGIIGRTGSGKTTLIRLITRLYDANAGSIRVGGVDVRALRLSDLRRRIGVVTQDVQLFRATVRDNLTLFDPAIADVDVERSLTELGLGNWLKALPCGLDTEIATGRHGLSAGEAQVLALARVFLKNPGLVILDEASSRLDPATQNLVEVALDRLLVGRTAIVIAHRLETVRRADDVLVLDDGVIVEYGERSVLARDSGSRYARLQAGDLVEVLS
jgi:ABC-type multidrug transport system fused ATPase/permease subunit